MHSKSHPRRSWFPSCCCARDRSPAPVPETPLLPMGCSLNQSYNSSEVVQPAPTMHLPRNALFLTQSGNWRQFQNLTNGQIFFVDIVTGESQWDPPKGWDVFLPGGHTPPKSSLRTYFFSSQADTDSDEDVWG